MTGAPMEYQSPEGQVRLLIADVDAEHPIFDVSQLAGFLAIEGGNVKRAGARALRTIAASEVLVAKKITTQDLSTDGPAVAAELRAQAKALEDEADVADAREGVDAYAAYIPGPGTHGRHEGEEAWVCH